LNIAYISNDIEKAKEKLLEEYEESILFEDNELKLPMVKEIKEEVYQTTDKPKTILIKAVTLRVEAQNSLLKILEETPDKVQLIILTTSKYALLDTIRSRVEVKEINFEKPQIDISFSLKSLNQKEIYEIVLKNGKKFSKLELKTFITELLKRVEEPNEELLNNFEMAMKLIDLNGDREAILSLLLLSIRNSNNENL
jgi:DNA polymerase-3 subunit delta'